MLLKKYNHSFYAYILHFAFSVESATWTKDLAVTNVDLRAVHFLEDGKNGWIVGNQERFLYK